MSFDFVYLRVVVALTCRSTGVYLATVELSSVFQPEEVTVHRVPGVLRDVLDVECVVRSEVQLPHG